MLHANSIVVDIVDVRELQLIHYSNVAYTINVHSTVELGESREQIIVNGFFRLSMFVSVFQRYDL